MHRFSLPSRTAGRLAAAVLALGASLAAGAGHAADAANGTYQAERARCQSGQAQQEMAACLREAGAAQVESRRGNLSGGDVKANAAQRCASLPPGQKADCEARVQGQGRAEGSVGGGGIIRETVTTVPAR